jgi:hypothetical protein
MAGQFRDICRGRQAGRCPRQMEPRLVHDLDIAHDCVCAYIFAWAHTTTARRNIRVVTCLVWSEVMIDSCRRFRSHGADEAPELKGQVHSSASETMLRPFCLLYGMTFSSD